MSERRVKFVEVPVRIDRSAWDEWFMWAALAVAWAYVGSAIIVAAVRLFVGGDVLGPLADTGFAIVVICWLPWRWRLQRNVNRLAWVMENGGAPR